MKFQIRQSLQQPACSVRSPLSISGMTIVEMLVAVGLSTMVLGGVMTLFTASLKNFTGMGNYASLTSQSRQSMDSMSKDIRQASQIVSFTNTPILKSLTLSNAFSGTTRIYTWDSASGNLVSQTGQTVRTNLTGCDSWDFSFYQRNPTNNWTFVSTTNLGTCKLINMTWKCSRSILGAKVNTEDLVTAEIVLRNKP
jgi:Tfp pilus assembly protein PilW